MNKVVLASQFKRLAWTQDYGPPYGHLVRVLVLALLISILGIFVAVSEDERTLMEFSVVCFLALVVLFAYADRKAGQLA